MATWKDAFEQAWLRYAAVTGEHESMLAKKSGVGLSTITRWLQGGTSLPDFDTCIRLGKVMGPVLGEPDVFLRRLFVYECTMDKPYPWTVDLGEPLPAPVDEDLAGERVASIAIQLLPDGLDCGKCVSPHPSLLSRKYVLWKTGEGLCPRHTETVVLVDVEITPQRGDMVLAGLQQGEPPHAPKLWQLEDLEGQLVAAPVDHSSSLVSTEGNDQWILAGVVVGCMALEHIDGRRID